MNVKSVLITGSNRGIGLEFVRQFLQNSTVRQVIGTCRHPDEALELRELEKEHSSLKVVKLDVCDDGDIQRVVDDLSSQELSEDGLSLLVNNAGVTREMSGLSSVTRDSVRQCVEVNTISPLILTRVFVPLLKKAASGSCGDDVGAAVINLSSELGSNQRCTRGGTYSYRISKAGVNMVSRCLHHDLIKHNIAVVAVHPGWVLTDMGGPRAPTSVTNSVSGMMTNIVEKMSKDLSGTFIDYEGKPVPY